MPVSTGTASRSGSTLVARSVSRPQQGLAEDGDLHHVAHDAANLFLRIAVVGSGPRGLSVLERLLDHARRHATIRLEVLLFDKAPHGPGCHVTDQSPHLLLNTAADQITMFPGDRSPEALAPRHARTFDQWIEDCRKRGLHGELIQLRDGSPVDSYQPRALLGHYLADLLEDLLEDIPAGSEVRLIRDEVQDLRKGTDGTWEVRGLTSDHVGIDAVVLSTGHHLPRRAAAIPSDGRIRELFPIRETLAQIPDRSTVAIQGMGLSALDVIAELTLGRGGAFEREGDELGLRYVPSGREPRLLAYSRSGLPLRSRPRNEKTRPEQRLGRNFTRDSVLRWQQVHGKDFEVDLLPPILLDMADAYAQAVARIGGTEEDAADTVFTWETLQQPVPGDVLSSPQTFRRFLSEDLRRDISASRQGNLHSPLKAAHDVLRDHRELVGRAVDFGGLHGASQAWFNEEFLPAMKRLSVGPPVERIEQLLALVDAGLLQMDFGPGATCSRTETGWEVVSDQWPEHRASAAYFIDARIPVDGPGDDPLLRRLVDNGHARYFRNEQYTGGGLEVDRQLNIIDADGRPDPTLCALGVATEGARFYTFFLPRPYARARFEEDAEVTVESLFAHFAAGSELAVRVMT